MKGIEKLHPLVRVKAERLLAICKENGLPIIITQTLRSKEEQDALFAKGRDTTGNITNKAAVVTYAKYPHSMHCWGLAFDVAREDGKPDESGAKGYYNGDKFFEQAGAIGRNLGLTWGGDWLTFKDRPHFEDKTIDGAMNAVVKKYGTPDKFFGTWQ